MRDVYLLLKNINIIFVPEEFEELNFNWIPTERT